MPDELELSLNDSQEPDITEETGYVPENSDETPKTKEELEKIFEERFELFMSQLSERVEQENVPVALAIVVDPKYPATPMVYKAGHIYDQARLAAHILRMLRQQMDEELSL